MEEDSSLGSFTTGMRNWHISASSVRNGLCATLVHHRAVYIGMGRTMGNPPWCAPCPMGMTILILFSQRGLTD
ncbi:MAG: hypothetical protein ACETV1_02045 [Candidatus Bathyarchaeia archaeon]